MVNIFRGGKFQNILVVGWQKVFGGDMTEKFLEHREVQNYFGEGWKKISGMEVA